MGVSLNTVCRSDASPPQPRTACARGTFVIASVTASPRSLWVHVRLEMLTAPRLLRRSWPSRRWPTWAAPGASSRLATTAPSTAPAAPSAAPSTCRSRAGPEANPQGAPVPPRNTIRKARPSLRQPASPAVPAAGGLTARAASLRRRRNHQDVPHHSSRGHRRRTQHALDNQHAQRGAHVCAAPAFAFEPAVAAL